MSLAEDHDAEKEERGFFQRYGLVIGIAVVIGVVAVIFAGQSLGGKATMAHKMPEVTMVRLTPLPPPPPPPPPPPVPQQVQQEQKMIEQTPLDQPEQKPDERPAPPAAVGTNIKGDGPADGFGLSGNAGAGFFGGTGTGKGGGSRWGWYATQVQTAIGEALRKNSRTRDAAFRLEVRVWSDASGRVVRAQLAGTTGDKKVDDAIRDEVLTGLQLQEAPPQGMPMPIVMRLTARRPN